MQVAVNFLLNLNEKNATTARANVNLLIAALMVVANISMPWCCISITMAFNNS